MTLALSLLLPALVACSGGDDGDDGSAGDLGPMLPLDAAAVESYVARIDTQLPACTATGGGDTAAPAVLPVGGTGSTGSCGGTLDVTYDHGDGDTTYAVVFADYCLSSDATDVVIDGEATAFEDGTPSDAGPVVDTLAVDTEGPVTAAHVDGVHEVEVEGFVQTFGNPAAWTPGTPTADSPDVVTLERFAVRPQDGSEAEVSVVDLRFESYGDVPTLTVTDGAVVVDGEGHLLVTTVPGEPLVLDPFTAESGGLALEGEDGAVLVVRPTPGRPLAFTLELDGQPLDVGLDCTDGGPLLLELLPAIVAAVSPY